MFTGCLYYGTATIPNTSYPCQECYPPIVRQPSVGVKLKRDRYTSARIVQWAPNPRRPFSQKRIGCLFLRYNNRNRTTGYLAHHVVRNDHSSRRPFFVTSKNSCPLSSLTMSATTRARESCTPQQFHSNPRQHLLAKMGPVTTDVLTVGGCSLGLVCYTAHAPFLVGRI